MGAEVLGANQFDLGEQSLHTSLDHVLAGAGLRVMLLNEVHDRPRPPCGGGRIKGVSRGLVWYFGGGLCRCRDR